MIGLQPLFFKGVVHYHEHRIASFPDVPLTGCTLARGTLTGTTPAAGRPACSTLAGGSSFLFPLLQVIVQIERNVSRSRFFNRLGAMQGFPEKGIGRKGFIGHAL